MSQQPETRSGTRFYALLAVLVFQGLSGVAGGIGLVADPSGAALGIPQAWLEGSPFGDYLLPGLVLLLVLGVFPLVVVIGVWKRARWGRPAALAIGVMLLVWLFVEILVVGYQSEPPFQVIYAAIGLAIVALALPPSTVSH